MLKIIKNNLIPSVIAALIVVGFLVGIGVAVSGGGTITAGNINKGLVFHAPLNSESEKVGSELVTSWANNDYNSVSFNGLDINNAVQSDSGAGADKLKSNQLTLTSGKTYEVGFNLTLNSGSLSDVRVKTGSDGSLTTFGGLNQMVSAGENTYRFIATASSSTARIGFRSNTNSDISVSGWYFKPIKTADVTPNANHGTVYGATQNSDNMSFDGTNDYVDMGNVNDMTTNDFSISAWFNTSVASQLDSAGIVEKRAGADVGYRLFFETDEKIHMHIYDGTDGDGVASINTVNDGVWHHAVGIAYISGGVWVKELYIDGVYQGSSSATSGNSISNSQNFYISKYSGHDYFNGSIKDVRIYNRALSATEVTALYDLGGRQNKISAGNINKGLVFHAPLDEKSEKVGSELVSNGNFDGTSNWNFVDADSGNADWDTSVDGVKLTVGDIKYGIPTPHVLQNRTIENGKLYILTFDGKTESGNGNFDVRFKFQYTSQPTYTFSLTESWQHFQAVVGPFVSGGYNRFFFYKDTNAVGKIYYMKNISLKEVQSADTTPNANHGTVYGATVGTDSTSFDGTNDYVATSSNIGISGSQARTMSVWVKSNSLTQPYYAMIMSIGEGTAGKNMFIGSYDVNNNWAFSFWTYNYDTGVAIDTTDWHHLVFVYDGSNYTGYIDNVVKVSGTQSINTTNSVLKIGKHWSSANYFNADIKDVRIYNRALTSTEVKALFDLGGRRRALSAGSLYKGLVLDMPLQSKDEKVGSDLVTNGQDWTGATGSTPPNSWWTTTVVRGLHTIINDGGDHTTALKLENVVTALNPYITTDTPGITTEVGKRYRVSADYKYVSGTGVRVRVGTTLGSSDYGNVVMEGTSTTWTTVTFDFTATSTALHIKLRLIGTVAGQYSYFDNVRVKELHTADTTPNANHGTVYGATQNSDNMSFDGTNNTVDLGDITGVIPENDDFTISIWYKTSIDNRALLGTMGTLWGMQFRTDRTYLVIGGLQDIYYNAPTDGAWHNLVMNRNGDVFTWYIDGQSATTSTISGSIRTGADGWPDNIVIGAKIDSTTKSGYWNGNLKDVRVYNRALSAAEVQLLYDQGR